MRKREHDEIVGVITSAYEAIIANLKDEIQHLLARNEDLLNRAMAQDWTAYTALSAVPQEPIVVPDRLYDGTGLIEIEVDE